MKKRKVPVFKTDEEAEAFLDQDLSDLDFSQFKPTHFEFQPKDKSINLRISEHLLKQVQSRARDEGIPYQRFIRQALERAIAQKRQPPRAKAAAPKTRGRVAPTAARAGR